MLGGSTAGLSSAAWRSLCSNVNAVCSLLRPSSGQSLIGAGVRRGVVPLGVRRTVTLCLLGVASASTTCGGVVDPAGSSGSTGVTLARFALGSVESGAVGAVGAGTGNRVFGASFEVFFAGVKTGGPLRTRAGKV